MRRASTGVEATDSVRKDHPPCFPGPAGQLHRHQEVHGRCQPHVLAAFQVELAGFFAAEAEGQKAVLAQESKGADDPVKAAAAAPARPNAMRTRPPTERPCRLFLAVGNKPARSSVLSSVARVREFFCEPSVACLVLLNGDRHLMTSGVGAAPWRRTRT